ncbi:MAG TPA: hypothetical protein VEJ41_03665 [Candidatus Acidoferrales bacterium]|nr:hypothetical protein [Candidatus Acidoferrales bacterium]
MDWLVHLMHAAAWTGVVILVFAIIGFIATIRWILGLFGRGEQAVEGAARQVGDAIERR